MGWWKRFNDWVDKSIDQATEAPLKDWEPLEYLWDSTDQPMQVECSDGRSTGEADAVAATAVGPSLGTELSNGPESAEKGGSGDVTTETTLEHADVLPSATFRVFPSAGNHRNSYDSEGSVRRAVAARKRTRERWLSVPGAVWVSNVKVYRAETVWRDVTDEYVSPDGQG